MLTNIHFFALIFSSFHYYSLFTCSRVQIQNTAMWSGLSGQIPLLLFLLLLSKTCGHIAAAYPRCTSLQFLHSNVLEDSLQPWMRGEPVLMPPQNALRRWMQPHSRDWWEREWSWKCSVVESGELLIVWQRWRQPRVPGMRQCTPGCHVAVAMCVWKTSILPMEKLH